MKQNNAKNKIRILNIENLNQVQQQVQQQVQSQIVSKYDQKKYEAYRSLYNLTSSENQQKLYNSLYLEYSKDMVYASGLLGEKEGKEDIDIFFNSIEFSKIDNIFSSFMKGTSKQNSENVENSLKNQCFMKYKILDNKTQSALLTNLVTQTNYKLKTQAGNKRITGEQVQDILNNSLNLIGTRNMSRQIDFYQELLKKKLENEYLEKYETLDLDNQFKQRQKLKELTQKPEILSRLDDKNMALYCKDEDLKILLYLLDIKSLKQALQNINEIYEQQNKFLINQIIKKDQKEILYIKIEDNFNQKLNSEEELNGFLKNLNNAQLIYFYQYGHILQKQNIDYIKTYNKLNKQRANEIYKKLLNLASPKIQEKKIELTKNEDIDILYLLNNTNFNDLISEIDDLNKIEKEDRQHLKHEFMVCYQSSSDMQKMQLYKELLNFYTPRFYGKNSTELNFFHMLDSVNYLLENLSQYEISWVLRNKDVSRQEIEKRKLKNDFLEIYYKFFTASGLTIMSESCFNKLKKYLAEKNAEQNLANIVFDKYKHDNIHVLLNKFTIEDLKICINEVRQEVLPQEVIQKDVLSVRRHKISSEFCDLLSSLSDEKKSELCNNLFKSVTEGNPRRKKNIEDRNFGDDLRYKINYMFQELDSNKMLDEIESLKRLIIEDKKDFMGRFLSKYNQVDNNQKQKLYKILLNTSEVASLNLGDDINENINILFNNLNSCKIENALYWFERAKKEKNDIIGKFSEAKQFYFDMYNASDEQTQGKIFDKLYSIYNTKHNVVELNKYNCFIEEDSHDLKFLTCLGDLQEEKLESAFFN